MRFIVLVFLGACSFGILSTFVKIAYASGFRVDEVVGSQTLFGAALTWIVAILYPRLSRSGTGPVPRVRIKGGQALRLMAVGITTGLTGIFYTSALQYIPASLAIVLLFQFTWLGVLLEAVVKRKRPENEKLYALVVLLIGTAFASGLGGDVLEGVSWLGVGLALLSSVTYTLFIWFSGKVAVELPPITRTAFITSGAALFCLIVFPPAFLFNGALSQGLWIWGGLLAFFGALIPPLLFSIGVPHIGAGLATILSAAELPVAVIMSFAVLHEYVSVPQWIGVAIILIGVGLPELLTAMKSRHNRRTNVE